MREAAKEQAAGAAEAGFQEAWRARAAAAVDSAVRAAREREDSPEVDAYGHLGGLHGAMNTLLLAVERADEQDAAQGLGSNVRTLLDHII